MSDNYELKSVVSGELNIRESDAVPDFNFINMALFQRRVREERRG